MSSELMQTTKKLATVMLHCEQHNIPPYSRQHGTCS